VDNHYYYIFYFCFFSPCFDKTTIYDMVQYIRSDKTTASMRDKINIILFQRFQPIVHRMVYDFTAHHQYKCKRIDKEELFHYGCTGLYHAVRKYKGTQPFFPYAKLYIRGQLYTCLTNRHPISTINKKERRKRKTSEQLSQELINPIKDNSYLGRRTNIESSHINPAHTHTTENNHLSCDHNRLHYSHIWQYIQTLPLFVQRIFYYKYDYFLQVIRTNKHIAELMCTSEEYVRQTLRENIVDVIYNSSLSFTLQ
jgi:RNA polymerase sigma factor (sigma-70 family)